MITIEEQTRRRRPLRVRNLEAWTRLLHFVGKTSLTPNQVSVVGMVAGLGAGGLLGLTGSGSFPPAAVPAAFLTAIALVLIRGGCNIFDGILAVETGRASRVGLLFNEVPDRVSDVALLVGAGHAIGGDPLLGWIAALGAMATAYLRVQVQIAGASSDYRGPMAKPARMGVLVAALVVQLVIPAGADAGVIRIALLLIIAGTILTTLRRLFHAARELQSLPSNESA